MVCLFIDVVMVVSLSSRMLIKQLRSTTVDVSSVAAWIPITIAVLK